MKRILALLLMAVVIVGSVFFGMWRSLSSMRADVERAFVTAGEKADGVYTESIEEGLLYLAGESYNLVVIARNYFADDDADITAVLNARDTLTNADTIADKLTAFNALNDAVSLLYRRVADEPDITEQHLNLAKTYYGDITSEVSVIGDNHYNEKAVEFNKRLGSFPALFVAPLFGIREAVLFR